MAAHPPVNPPHGVCCVCVCEEVYVVAHPPVNPPHGVCCVCVCEEVYVAAHPPVNPPLPFILDISPS